MARKDADSVYVDLGTFSNHAQAQLDGFKTRTLRAEAAAQRHSYSIDWVVATVVEAAAAFPMLVLGDQEIETTGKRCTALRTARTEECVL